MRVWQQRALSERYAVVYLDALITSSRQNGAVAKRYLYVALGINMSGEKELLGLWGQATEGAYPQGASPQNICAEAHYSE